MIRRVAKIVGLCLLAVISAAVTTVVVHLYTTGGSQARADISYADFLSITLTALSILLTVVGLFLAALAVVGWTSFETKLKDHSAEYFSAQLGKNGPIRRELEDLITEIAFKGVEELRPSPREDGPYRD